MWDPLLNGLTLGSKSDIKSNNIINRSHEFRWTVKYNFVETIPIMNENNMNFITLASTKPAKLSLIFCIFSKWTKTLNLDHGAGLSWNIADLKVPGSTSGTGNSFLSKSPYLTINNVMSHNRVEKGCSHYLSKTVQPVGEVRTYTFLLNHSECKDTLLPFKKNTLPQKYTHQKNNDRNI